MPSDLPAPPAYAAMPPSEVMQYVVLPGLAGALAGLVGVAGLVLLDVGSIGTLLRGGQDGWLGTFLLSAGFVTTFGSAAIGGSIMSLGQDDSTME